MGIADDYVPESFLIALQKGVKGFKELTREHQVKLARFVWDDGSSRRKHNKWEGYMTIHYKELYEAFGRDRVTGGRFKQINDSLKMFEVTNNWQHSKGVTKGYKLTENVQAIKNKYLKPKLDQVTRLIRMDGKYVETLPKAIDAKDLNGITAAAWRDARVSTKAPVDLDRLKSLYMHLEKKMLVQPTGDLWAKADYDDIEYRIEVIGKLIRMAQTDVGGRGFVIHRYAESTSGRLYGKGATLQNAPRTIKGAALHGLWDYDIENCHYAIFSQMAAKYGYETTAINYYLNHKAEVRQGIAERVGISVDDAKMCLLAVMYGARTNEWHENAIPRTIGQAAGLLYKDRQFQDIAEDIKQGRRIILENHPKGRTTYTNAMNKRIRYKAAREQEEPDEYVKDAATPEQILAHLIQGVEAQALRKAISLCGEDVVVLMHDGFVSREQIDVAQLEQAIYEDTGYRLQVVGKVITLPADMDF